MNTLTLDEFPPASAADWRLAAEEALKGDSFDKKLRTRLPGGIILEPIYMAEDSSARESWPGLAPFVRGNHSVPRGVLVAQEIPYSDPGAFNTAACSDLARGQNALAVSCLPDDPRALALRRVPDFQRAFRGISGVPVYLWAGASALPLAGLVSAAGADWTDGAILADPLTEYARRGQTDVALDDAYEEMACVLRWAEGTNLKTVGVGAGVWADAGGSAVQEIAFGLATIVDYLRGLSGAGIAPEAAAPRFLLTTSLGANIFLEIAKLRAIRQVWAGALAALEIAAVPLHIHGRSGIFNKSSLDPCTNMLRITAEGFAGIVGGVESLQLAAYDGTARPPDEFSRRIARNVSTILSDECGLRNVADAAGGSWFAESLTAQLAEKSWSLFQEIESAGGMAAALAKNIPQRAVAETAQSRLDAVAHGREGLIGVNRFPNPAETPLEHLPPPADEEARPGTADPAPISRIRRSVAAVDEAFRQGCTLVQAGAALFRSVASEPRIACAIPVRAAAGHEALRARALRERERTGELPRIWLAVFGPPKQHKARADFAAAFFAAGGFDVRSGQPQASLAEAASQAAASGAPVAVICSSDETYPAIVPEFCAALRSARSGIRIILAGYPKDQIDAFRAAGVDDFIHIQSNGLEFLQNLQRELFPS